MKVLFNKVYSVFSKLFLIIERYSYSLTEVQIYNSVLSYICRTLSLPYHKLFRTANGTFSKDIYHQLQHYPQGVRKLLLHKLSLVFDCIFRYPQYLVEILSSSVSFSLLSAHFHERYNRDKTLIVTKYGHFSEEFVKLLIKQKLSLA